MGGVRDGGRRFAPEVKRERERAEKKKEKSETGGEGCFDRRRVEKKRKRVSVEREYATGKGEGGERYDGTQDEGKDLLRER